MVKTGSRNLLVIVLATFSWITFQSWFIIMNVFDLNGGGQIDTATFEQSLSSAIFSHQFFVNTVPGNSFFSVHASTILFAILPFYAISTGFISLYIIQAVIIYSPAIVIFLLARKRIGDNYVSLLLGLSYLIYPAITPNVFEALTLFSGFAIFSYYFFDNNRKIAFSIFFLLMLSTMEFSPIIGFVFGIYVLLISPPFIRSMKKIFGMKESVTEEGKTPWIFYSAFSIIVSTAMFVFDIKFIAYSSAGTHSAFINLYGTNVFSSSQLLYNASFADPGSKIDYLLYLNFPYLFLSFMDPVSLLQLPWFAAGFITSFSPYYSYGVYYEAYIWPFVVIGAVGGLYKLSRSNGKVDLSKVKKIVVLMFIVMMISWTAQYAFSYSQNMPLAIPQEDRDYIQSLLPIQQGSPLTTQASNVEFTSAYDWNSWFFGGNKEYVIISANSYEFESLQHYGLYSASGQYLVYEENYTGSPVLDNYDNSMNGKLNSPDQNVSLFVPDGSYKVSVTVRSGIYDSAIVYNENSSSNKEFDVNSGIVIPFTVNETQHIKTIITPYKLTQGYYMVNSMITTSLNSSSEIAQSSYGAIANQTSYEYFPYNITLQKGNPYYFWEMTTGYPGGIKVPYSNGSSYQFQFTPSQGKYPYLNEVSSSSGKFNVTDVNESFPMALITNKTASNSMDYKIYVDGIEESKGTVNHEDTFVITSDSNGMENISLDFGLLKFSMMNGSEYYVSVESLNYKPYGNIFLDYPITALIIPLAIGNIVIIAIDRDKHIDHFVKYKGKVMAAISIASLSFFILFALYYFKIIDSPLTISIFRYTGITIALLGGIYFTFLYKDLKMKNKESI